MSHKKITHIMSYESQKKIEPLEPGTDIDMHCIKRVRFQAYWIKPNLIHTSIFRFQGGYEVRMSSYIHMWALKELNCCNVSGPTQSYKVISVNQMKSSRPINFWVFNTCAREHAKDNKYLRCKKYFLYFIIIVHFKKKLF